MDTTQEQLKAERPTVKVLPPDEPSKRSKLKPAEQSTNETKGNYCCIVMKFVIAITLLVIAFELGLIIGLNHRTTEVERDAPTIIYLEVPVDDLPNIEEAATPEEPNSEDVQTSEEPSNTEEASEDEEGPTEREVFIS